MGKKNIFGSSIRSLRRDKRFASLIKKHGPPDLTRGKDHFQALMRSIIHQQVSGAAANTIHARFLALFPKGRSPTPEMVRTIPLEKMRAAGLSGQKASYIKDLAEKFSDGTIKHRVLHKMESADIVGHLTRKWSGSHSRGGLTHPSPHGISGASRMAPRPKQNLSLRSYHVPDLGIRNCTLAQNDGLFSGEIHHSRRLPFR